ncbi:MAG: aldehyde ferredoxin oxidoreductase family protein [Oscillochloridaceae bacterium umkhey_bin13]
MALRTLTVDLERGLARQQLPATVERDYLGGRGAIAWLLWHYLPPDTPPLAADNLLIFASGPLAGTSAFATGGFMVGTRSPLTGAIGYSWAQGHWGARLRQVGYDVLVVRGQAPDWVYLLIDGDQVRLRPAGHLLGLDTVATNAALQAELGERASVVCLGPAGEADVAYATMVAEGRYMAEPAGTGAVMAAKHLKAIVIRGGNPVEAPDPRRLAAAQEVIRRRVETSPIATAIKQAGTIPLLAHAAGLGALTGQNGSVSQPDPALAQAFEQLAHQPVVSRGCNGCPMPCFHDLKREDGNNLPRPELETLAGFGARCGISDPEVLATLADRCLRLGLDPVATSAALAFLMECQERGLTHSGKIAWGDADAILAAIERLGMRQEKRDVLSLGVGEMQEIFWGSAVFAPQARGQAMPALDPRALNGLALALATAAIGADHRYAMFYEELVATPPSWLPDEASGPHETRGKALRLIWHERFAAMLDTAGVCRRLGIMAYQVSPGELLALMMASGATITAAEMVRIGERIITVERLFARRYADNVGRDDLPARWRDVPLTEGPAADHRVPLGELLAEYYRRHGWNAQGDPSPERLAELGIKV